MKTIPPPCPEPEVGPKYWRSLDQLADTPEFRQWVEKEFPAGASELTDPVSRRHFVKIMSASFMLAGLGLAGSGCRRPEETILPFSKMPEGYVHGVAQYFATARPSRGMAIPLVVKSHDGRPTKIEGNPEFPNGNGGTDVFTQASILNLYDPDRAMGFGKNGSGVSREEALEFLNQLSKQFSANGGEGLSFLLERSSSPSRERLQKIVAAKFPKARWHIFEPVDFDVHRAGATQAFGQPVRPEFHLEKASRILSLDCDFIGSEEEAYRLIRGFAKTRKISDSADEKGRKISDSDDVMSRLYAVEAMFTLTGANADHRLRIPSSQVAAVAAAVAVEILQGGVSAEVTQLAAGYTGKKEWIHECAADLRQQGKKSVVLAGHQQPLVVHVLANAINSALGSAGEVVTYVPAPAPSEKSISDLVKALSAGEVDTLVVLGGNPVYSAPADLDFSNALKKAKAVVRLGYYEDETFAASTWHFPQAHYLESWGDARTADGTVVSIQPLIEPLFGGVTELEILARLAGSDSPKPYDTVRETFKGTAKPGNFEEDWKKYLYSGFLSGSASAPVAVKFSSGAFNGVQVSAVAAPGAQNLEVIFHRDAKVDDGRYNNNGWLQELPEPVTKMCWENVILLSPATAAALNLTIVNKENNKLMVPWVKVQMNGREIEGPVWIQPGQADNTISLALGYGRTRTGRVGRGSGYDAYRLRTSTAAYIAGGAKLSDTGKKHQLSTTQDHGAMEGRPIIREGNLADFKKNPGFAKRMNMELPEAVRDEHGRPRPLYANPFDARKATGIHQWGMSIDLNSCVGCSACMVACQSENNVPIVGKDMVARNREMHWIRIDRYFSGPKEDPQMVNQPMLCQHCEAAPCENVCPVNATSHDEEGLNVMTYNRCVGTRYCSNNCPYKVRRFNYLDYHKRTLDQLKGPFFPSPMVTKVDGEWGITKWLKDPDKGYRTGDDWELLKLIKNPDVTVRMRGVMEKCSLCLQRIEQAKIARKVKAGASGDIRLSEKEGTVPKTACQQACPAEAIVFGDISDPESAVSKLKTQERDYTVLDFLLTKPRTTYLARVRNPNPEMPDYYAMPLSAREFSEKNGNPFEEHPEHGGGGKAPHVETGKKGAH